MSRILVAMARGYPSPFNECCKESLRCNACEFTKHTKVPYPSLDLRSDKLFEIIHSDVWGHRRVVTFMKVLVDILGFICKHIKPSLCNI
jgi:hypothetical protein